MSSDRNQLWATYSESMLLEDRKQQKTQGRAVAPGWVGSMWKAGLNGHGPPGSAELG